MPWVTRELGKTTIDLRSDAWFGDRSYRLEIPREWELTTLGPRHLSPLTPEQIRTAVRRPISSPPLSALARTRNRAGIILDDLSRPTPTADLLPAILDELAGGGLGPDSVTVVIAVGAHAAADDSQVRRKLGSDWYGRLRVVPHECRGDLCDLGKSSRGTPIHVNRHLMDCDLKIGVGGIYPHASAGFSGGGKIVMPGVCGIESARFMHQQLGGSPARGDLIDGEQRRDIEEVARRVGLSFIVNAVLDGDRRIAGVFAGDPQQAFREGARFASDHLAIRDDVALRTADVVIADTYPFDTTLQFAVSKAIWPLLRADPDSVPVALAACPAGIGHHELASIQLPLARRALRRLRHLSARELARVPDTRPSGPTKDPATPPADPAPFHRHHDDRIEPQLPERLRVRFLVGAPRRDSRTSTHGTAASRSLSERAAALLPGRGRPDQRAGPGRGSTMTVCGRRQPSAVGDPTLWNPRNTGVRHAGAAARLSIR